MRKYLAIVILSFGFWPIAVRGADEQKPELVLQAGHARDLQALLFGPRNSWLASGGFDNIVRIWNVENGCELRALTGHTGAIKWLGRSDDGKTLVSSSADGTLRVWKVDDGTLIKELGNFPKAPRAVALSPDGSLLAVAFVDGESSLYNLKTDAQPKKLNIGSLSIRCLIFSQDSTKIISAATEPVLRITSVATGKNLKSIKTDEHLISSLSKGTGNDLIAAASDDGSLQVWDTTTGRREALAKLSDAKIVSTAVINPQLIYAFSANSEVFEVKVGAPAPASKKAVLKGDIPSDVLSSAIFSSDGTSVAVGTGGGAIGLFDPSTGNSTRELRGYTIGAYGVAVSPDSRWLASAGLDKMVRVWDLQSGEPLPALAGNQAAVAAVAFHPDNKQVISAGYDKTIQIWKLLSGESPRVLSGHRDTVGSLVIGKSGRLLVSGSNDMTVGIWDLEGKLPTRFLTGHTSDVSSVCMSDDERTILSGSGDGTVRTWDVESGRETNQIDTRSGWINGVALSPDGKLAATAGRDSLVRVFEITTRREIHTLRFHNGPVNAVTFADNGTRLISSGYDGTIATWSVTDGRPTGAFIGPAAPVYGTASLGLIGILAAATSDGVVLWDQTNKSQIASLISINNGLNAGNDWLVITPDGGFDGSPEAWSRLAWRFDRKTFDLQPVEQFFREFFTPNLLRRLVKGEKQVTPKISSKNRAAPKVEIKVCDTQASDPRKVKICLWVSDGGSGANDLYLSRNGSLVRVWRGNLLTGSKPFETEASLIAGQNRFTAYAFNSDDIKSSDERLTVQGSPELRRKATSYILGIGINRYSNSRYDLNQAVNDASAFRDEIRRKQLALGSFENVIPIILINEQATKANIMGALAELATKIGPEDMLTIFFAGHGVADKNQFFLVPHDMGYDGLRLPLGEGRTMTILANSISDQDLRGAIEPIDARRVVLIIDACRSGQLLETEDYRQAPMNSKGLAQLAYDKGMYILTASQNYQAAKETPKLGHGYLTYALVEDGLKANQADWAPKDGEIMMREWLDFAVDRVPQLDRQQREQPREKQPDQPPPRETVSSRELIPEASGPVKIDERTLQRPKVFYRREADLDRLVIALNEKSPKENR